MYCLNDVLYFLDKWRIYIQNLYDCYLLALKEYTIDSRGDIGAWVREAAMTGLHVKISSISHIYIYIRLLKLKLFK